MANSKSQRDRQQELLDKLLGEVGLKPEDLKAEVRERMLAAIALYQHETEGTVP